MTVFEKLVAIVENLLTSYRIGKPRNSKIPPRYKKRDSPKYLLRYLPGDSKKYEIRILGVFFWYFRGIFSISCCRWNSDVGVVILAYFGFGGLSIL